MDPGRVAVDGRRTAALLTARIRRAFAPALQDAAQLDGLFAGHRFRHGQIEADFGDGGAGGDRGFDIECDQRPPLQRSHSGLSVAPVKK